MDGKKKLDPSLEKIRAKVHNTVSDIVKEQEKDMNVSVSHLTLLHLTELVIGFAAEYAKDIESFSNHRKKAVINADDVLLAARKNPTLQARLRETMDESLVAKTAESASTSEKRSVARQREPKASKTTTQHGSKRFRRSKPDTFVLSDSEDEVTL